MARQRDAPVLHPELCKGCLRCVPACAQGCLGPGTELHPVSGFAPVSLALEGCTGCGLCIEACPTRSLTMSNEYELALDNRQDLIYTKEQLMAPLLPGMEAPPHPMRLGEDEKDYYTVASQAPLQQGPVQSTANVAGRPITANAHEVGGHHE